MHGPLTCSNVDEHRPNKNNLNIFPPFSFFTLVKSVRGLEVRYAKASGLSRAIERAEP